MIFLLLSILTNAALVLILKAFDKFNVNLFYAIVINYITAASFGFLFSFHDRTFHSLLTAPWLGIAGLLGCCFISLFYIIGRSTQTSGVAATSVANKMSLVIPVLFAFLYYNDSLSVTKIAGIILALVAVFLSSLRSESKKSNARIGLLPLIIFFGSGILDTLINFAQKEFQLTTDSPLFVSCAFASAALIGTSMLLYKMMVNKITPDLTTFFAGIFLGLVNYFSMYFLMLALDRSELQSSVLFPLNNMGIVMLAAIFALVLFKEKLSWKNWIGLLIAVFAIALFML